MSVVAVPAADEAQPIAAVERVAHVVPGERAVDAQRRLGRLALPVDRGHLGHGFEFRVGREVPVGRHGTAGRVVGEGQGREPAQAFPELGRGLVAWVDRREQLYGVTY